MRGVLVAICAVLAFWWALVALFAPPKFILPSPMDVGKAFYTHHALLFEHFWITFLEIALGFGLGGGLGAALALFMVTSKTLRAILQPILVFSQAVPVFALAPLLTLWLGFGLLPKVTMAAIIIFFPVASAFYDGLSGIPRGYADLAKSLRAKKIAELWYLRLPYAMPNLASGLRLAAVYAPIGAVIGEWVGASRGLGYVMLLANGRTKTDLMFAATFCLGILAILIYLIVFWLTKPMMEMRDGPLS